MSIVFPFRKRNCEWGYYAEHSWEQANVNIILEYANSDIYHHLTHWCHSHVGELHKGSFMVHEYDFVSIPLKQIKFQGKALMTSTKSKLTISYIEMYYWSRLFKLLKFGFSNVPMQDKEPRISCKVQCMFNTCKNTLMVVICLKLRVGLG